MEIERVTSFFGRRMWARRLPFLLLAGAVILTAAGGIQAYRAVVTNQAVAEELIRDYSVFAAWVFEESFRNRLRSTLDDHFEPVSRTLNRGRRSRRRGSMREAGPSPDPQVLLSENGDTGNRGGRIDGGYAFRFVLDTVDGSESNVFREGPLLQVATIPDNDAHPDPDVIERVVRDHARDHYDEDWEFVVVNLSEYGMDLPPLVYGLFPGVEGAQLAYGFELDLSVVRRLLSRVLQEEDLLPPLLVGNKPNEELVAVTVQEASGKTFFASNRSPDPRFAVDVPVPEPYGSFVLRIAVLPEIAQQLVIGGLPQSRLPLLVGVFALATLMALLALGQLRREDQLALLRSDFVASVSHELRTPLAQIRLYLDTLKLGRAPTVDQQKWSIDNMDRETTRLIHLVENVLEFSRAERHPPPLSTDVLNLRDHVEDVIETFEPLAKPKRTHIVAAVPPWIQVRMNRDALRQVLVNLLGNAVKYGPTGQTVEVAATMEVDLLNIYVDDAGPGVPSDERSRIWESFYRGSNVVGTVSSGSGIGLAVVKEIVERHGGRVWVDDAPGGGGRLGFSLPSTAVVTESDHPSQTIAGSA